MFHTAQHEKPGYYIESPKLRRRPGRRRRSARLLQADLGSRRRKRQGAVTRSASSATTSTRAAPPCRARPSTALLAAISPRSQASNIRPARARSPRSEGVWDYEHLDHFIERPKDYAPATLMNFAGINSRSPASRIAPTSSPTCARCSEAIPLPPRCRRRAADGAAPVPVDGAACRPPMVRRPQPIRRATPAAPAAPATPAPAHAWPGATRPALIHRTSRLTDRRVAHSFDIVPVRIEHERAVVSRDDKVRAGPADRCRARLPRSPPCRTHPPSPGSARRTRHVAAPSRAAAR